MSRNIPRGIFLVLGSLLFALISFQCIEKPLSFIAPYTNMNMSIGLVDKTYDLQHINSTVLKVKDDQTFYYDSTVTNAPVQTAEIRLQPLSAGQSVRLGQFKVDALSGLSPITISPYPIDIDVPNGFPYPEFDTATAGSSFDMSSQFGFISITNGSISLTIENTSPFQVDIPAIVLRNDDDADKSEIAQFVFPTLDSLGGAGQSTYTSTVDLAGKMIRGKLKFDSIHFAIKGRTGPFTIKAGSGLSIGLSSTDFISDSASAVIPHQTITSATDSLLVLDDSVVIHNAQFKSGKFDLEFQNQTGVTVQVYLKFNEFIGSSGSSLEIDEDLTAHQNTIVSLALDTLQFQSSLLKQFGTDLTFSIGIRSIGSNTPVTLTSNDNISTNLSASEPIILKSITGKIKPTVYALNSGTAWQLGDMTKLQANFLFDSISIGLDILPTGFFYTSYDLKLYAWNKKNPGNIQTLDFPPIQQTIGPPQKMLKPTGSYQTIVLDNSTLPNGLSAFLSNFPAHELPDTMVVSGTLIMNPSGIYETNEGIQTISDTSKIYSRVRTMFPVRMGVGDGVVMDTIDLSGNKAFPKDIATSTNSAAINFRITNALPFSLKFRAVLLGALKLDGTRDSLQAIPSSGFIEIAPASIDIKGFVSEPAVSLPTLQLVGSELAKFGEAEAMWYKIEVNTTNGANPPVSVIRLSDWIRIQASSTMNYTINKPK